MLYVISLAHNITKIYQPKAAGINEMARSTTMFSKKFIFSNYNLNKQSSYGFC